MTDTTNATEKILAQIKGLRNHLEEDEHPLMTLPAIWDNDQQKRGTPCEVIVTNRRLIGYYSVSFPRERLFLDTLTLSQINNVSIREKSFEPIFRELLVSEGKRKVYIRAPRQKIEELYAELRSTIETFAPATKAAFARSQPTTESTTSPAPVYGRQEIRTSFESSNLAIVLLFVGGLALEIAGALFWANVGQQVGLPLCIAGFVMVFAAIIQRRQRS